MRILVAGATGSIGIHVVNTAIAMGHQPVALVRNRRKIKLLPRGTDIFYGDVSIPETLTDLPKDIDAIIFTLGSDGQGRIGARAIDYGGVRNILRIFMDTPVRIALMTTIGVTERLSSWNQRTEVHDWKRRSERLVRASGHIYTIVRPGWFDYNNDDEHRIVMLQGDRRHAGTPEDGVISREQIAQVLVTALSNDAAKNKTFELVAERHKMFLQILSTTSAAINLLWNQTVELGQVRSSRLAKAGDLSSAVGFNIKLNDCDTNVSSNAAVAFLGTTVTSNDDTLALQSSAAGSAQNVGIQILDRTGEVLVLDGATFSAKTDLIDGTNILPFQARYIALGQSVAGTANADATFKVQYL
ncbi:NAD(P)H-binding protein [Escherichia coli]|nr:NAD(P)H-binding protein [Escherichia coli]